MNIQELKERLKIKGVNEETYSLDGTLYPMRVILYKNYSKWEVFYLDERGNRDGHRIFYSENDACLYMYKELTGEDIEDPIIKKNRIQEFNDSKQKIIELISEKMQSVNKSEKETLANISDILQSYTFEDRFERKGVLTSLIKRGVVSGLRLNGLEPTDIIIKEIIKFDQNIK